MQKILEYAFEGEGMTRVFENAKWMVGIKNWKPMNDIANINCLERHNETDELFILLAGKCEKVIMLQDLPYFTGESRLQDVLFAHDNVEKHVDMKITGIKTENGKICAVTAIDNATGIEADYACDGFFEAIGLIPENDDFKGFADLTQFGYFDSKEDCVTKTPGLFVAGDCRSKFIRQVTTACGDGAVAALAACRYVDLLAK